MDVVEGKKEKELKPPYGAIKWYKDFLDIASRQKITKVDKAFLSSYSIAPGVEYKVINGLEFLGLIEEHGNAAQTLFEISMAGDEGIKNLEKLIHNSYAIIFDEIDIQKAIFDDIVNKFMRKYGISKTSATESAKIFIFLLDLAKIPISESLKESLISKTASTEPKKNLRKPAKIKSSSKINNNKLENMHSIIWGSNVIIYLKEGDIQSAEMAISLIDMYIKQLKSILK